jgi:nanoRNase/pAp phosphatase (c-di-AMP/oligoRNAs hydrolase)
MSQERLKRLFEAVAGASSINILPHNNPDPDAIASAVALRYLLAEKLGLAAKILFRGMIGRAENKALVQYLADPLQPLLAQAAPPLAPLALVDTQPGLGHVDLPPSARVLIAIDHHAQPDPAPVVEVGFADIRPDLGATSTILVGYLRAAKLRPTPPLATALFYGIKTNTMGLGRNADPADVKAYFYLQSMIDVEALAEIERAQVPVHYFKSFDSALQAAKVYQGVVVAYIGRLEYPDLVAEIADLLLRLEACRLVFCTGLYEETLIVSIRTRSRQEDARQLIGAVIEGEGTFGGHGSMAGGQIPLKGRQAKVLAEGLGKRVLRLLNVAGNRAKKGTPLI